MGFQDSMNDLKSVSFELLYSQVSSLVTSYNELKASGEINDAFEKRLLILQKTISSMRNLIQNVEDFNGLSGNVALNDASLNKEDALADFISNSKDNNEVPVNDSGLVFTAPLISSTPVSSGPIIDSNPVQTDSNPVPVSPINTPVAEVPATEVVPVTEEAPSVQEPVTVDAPVSMDSPIENATNTVGNDQIVAPIPASAVETPTTEVVPVAEEAPSVQEPVTVDVPVSMDAPIENATNTVGNDQIVAPDPVTPVDVNVRAIASLEKFKKISDSPVKAIIVNDSQFNKLASSLNAQAEQLDFGASGSENSMNVEAMIEKANDLYNQGDRQAAEEIYNKINSMTLVKKAA